MPEENELAEENELTEDLEREKAFGFLGTVRGQYIMGQALQVAIDCMSKVEPEESREVSNIRDMEFLRDNLFSMGAAVQQARDAGFNIEPELNPEILRGRGE